MNILSKLVSFIMGCTLCKFSAAFNQQPICTIYTPDSILSCAEKYQPLFVGDRRRYSTCTGVAWWDHNYLVTVNLYGQKLNSYRFDPLQATCEHIQEVAIEYEDVRFPENLAISPDGGLLAVCCDSAHSGILLYRIDKEQHRIAPNPIYYVPKNNLVHNVRFTHDGTYIAYACFDDNDALGIYRIQDDSHHLILERVHKKKNRFYPAKAKAINFTHDNKFIVVAYCFAIGINKTDRMGGTLVSYTFDCSTGMIGDEVSRIKHSFCTEDIAFAYHDSMLVVSDQAHDMLITYTFDPKTGCLGNIFTTLNNLEARLSFPHGLSVSDNDEYLAVTNYGDDSCNVYALVS